MLAFEDNCFYLQVTAFFYKKNEFLFKLFLKSTLYLTKRPITEKRKQQSSKAKEFFLDIIMLMLLAKFEFDRWFHFVKNKELSKK